MGSVQRRIAAVAVESTRGTFVSTMNANNSGLPTIRDLKVTPSPSRIDRPTLRLSLTDVADIYTGTGSVEVSMLVEIGGVPANPASGTILYQAPVWADLFRACGFEELTDSTGHFLQVYTGITGLTGGTAGSPIRHGEVVNVNHVTSGSFVATAVGDFFSEDNIAYLDATPGQAIGSGAITLVGATSGRSSTGTVVRDPSSVCGFRLRSDINAMEACSIEAYVDGKRWRVKGAMGNFELLMNHADVFQARFTMRGVYVSYLDIAIPGNANESHYIPPTFLGKDVRFFEIASAPKGYGRRTTGFPNNPGTPAIVGALNRVTINSGNEVILRENSLDPAGFTHALITDRSPSGSFNPDEVLNTDFDFIGRFISGAPTRFKAFLGVNTARDGNTFDVIAPGCVASSVGDGDRDNIHAWDYSFDLTGGDYDPSAAGEAPGNDNELVLIHR